MCILEHQTAAKAKVQLKLLDVFEDFNIFVDMNGSIIHVIFSSSQIGRFGISQREIGVSDREIFAL